MNTIIAQTTFKFRFSDNRVRKFMRDVEYIDIAKEQFAELMKMPNRAKFFLTKEEAADKKRTLYDGKKELMELKDALERKEHDLNVREAKVLELEKKVLTSKTKSRK